jgi:hypothetical protein
MLNTNDVFIFQYCWSRKHNDEKPYGARPAIAGYEYNVYLTSVLVSVSNWPTKSRYNFLSGQEPKRAAYKSNFNYYSEDTTMQ